jgi:DNA repair protein SbcD/Mre11
MRFLHTSDWHLGRSIRGLSRQSEFERVLDQVVMVARDEAVDVLLIAGDTFDTFSPPSEAEQLLYEALERVVGAGTKVVMIAGNHDHARRMDALSGVLRLAKIHTVGSLPERAEGTAISVPSRDESEAACIVALPWVPERQAIEFEKLFAATEEPLKRYAEQMDRSIRRVCQAFDGKTVNIFMAHLLLDGVVIGPDSGERPIHIGQTFAVKPQSLPDNSQYVALGHVHKPQQMVAASPTYYAGSLLQLDFGEAQQEKSLSLVDVKAGLPAQVKAIPVVGGRGLRNITTTLESLPGLADSFGDDYLRVSVIGAPVSSLYERVREVLPNAVDVSRVAPEETTPATVPDQRRRLEPGELFATYYRSKLGADIPPPLLELFRQLYAEHEHAAA